MNNFERYVLAAREAGCPRDQVLNFADSSVVLQPKQLRFAAACRACDVRCRSCEADALAGREPVEDCPACGPTKVGYGGARSGGKSHVGLAQIFCDDAKRFAGLKGLYLRKVGKSGDEAVQDLRRSVLHSTPHHYHQTKKILTRADNGSMVRLGHFQSENDIDQYLGIEYDFALIEEATQLTYSKVRNIATCVRTSKPGWRPRMYFTTNPGGLGHAWFKEMFIRPLRAGAERSTRFIQATVRDNRFVDPENRRELMRLEGWQRAAWLDGDWDVAAGQYFTNFRRELVLGDVESVPDHWRVWQGFDYGFQHYTACYPMALDGDGNLWVIDEHAERGWLPADHVGAIKAMLGRHGLEPGHLEGTYAGGDLFNVQRDGRTIAEDYASLGLPLERANINRIDGAAEILRRLGNPESDPPRPGTLFISKRCGRLLDCLPDLQRDPDRAEDVLKVDCDEDGKGGDDYYDAFRYGVMRAAVKPMRRGRDPFGGKRW